MKPQATVALAKLVFVALVITLVPQGLWSVLIVANLRASPAVPWSVLVMAAVIVVLAQYLRGHWGPTSTAAARRQSLRATVVPAEAFGWAWLAGALSITALVGVWIVLASLIRMPGSVLPDLSKYPWWTAVLAVAMGMLISPLCEQAGIWGYLQGGLERRWSGTTAVILAALVFALLPHPPAGMALVPKVLFFFLVGLVFSTMARLTNSILPGLPLHALGLLVFFALVWPHDTDRRLVSSVGADLWFWMHVAQAVVFAGLGLWAFGRLAHVSVPQRRDGDRPDGSEAPVDVDIDAPVSRKSSTFTA
jgi:membrane protease YdiL (CAAX protease family)